MARSTRNTPAPQLSVARFVMRTPFDYRSHFDYSEFKFRWIEALGRETMPWRRGIELFTASMLCFYMDEYGRCFPAVQTLASQMRKSPDTIRRALRTLEEHGWLLIEERGNRTNVYDACLPPRGLELLVEARAQPAAGQRSSMIQRRVGEIIDVVCAESSIHRPNLEKHPDFGRITGTLAQVLNRLGDDDSTSEKFERWMASPLPLQTHSAVGVLIERAALFRKEYTHAGGKKKAVDPVVALQVETAIKNVSVSRALNKRQPAGGQVSTELPAS